MPQVSPEPHLVTFPVKLSKLGSALLMLNRYQFSIEPRDEGDDHGSFYRSRAALGVQSVLRMVLDGTQQCSNFTDQHVDSAPVWGIHRIFKATMLYLELGNKEEDKEEWATSLPLAKSLLKSLTPRWRIAGMSHLFSCQRLFFY